MAVIVGGGFDGETNKTIQLSRGCLLSLGGGFCALWCMVSRAIEADLPTMKEAPTRTPSTNRVVSIDALRGLAAVAVSWFHLASTFPDFPSNALMRSSARYGELGVHIFFVISGFVMPWALHRAHYQPRNFGRFLCKRLVRIDIPCYASLALGVGLACLWQPLFRWDTPPEKIGFVQLILHLGYLNWIAGFEFLNGVLWTLAVELQYYLLLGIMFPLLVAKEQWARWFPLLLLGLLGFVEGSPLYMFRFGFLFALGFAVFQFRAGLMHRAVLLLCLPLLSIGAWQVAGLPVAVVGFATALTIAFLGSIGSKLKLLGDISFSLYLLHVPIGLRVVTYGMRFTHSALSQATLLAIALVVSVATAWLFWRWVERPAHRWAASISY